MDSPISISSYSSSRSDGSPDALQTANQLDTNAQFDGLDPIPGDETVLDRPVKRRKVYGPDGIATNAASIDPSALLGPTVPSRQPTDIATALQDNPESVPENHDPLLTHILELFPDISHSHVMGLIARHKAVALKNMQGNVFSGGDIGQVIKDAVVEDILEQPPYPKQEKAKRKNIDEDDDSKWINDTSNQQSSTVYLQMATFILAQEFSCIPMQHIRKIVCDKKRLYTAYLALFNEDNQLEQRKRTFDPLKKRRNIVVNNHASPQTGGPQLRDDLARELSAAKRKAREVATASRQREEEEEIERRNEEEHIRTGNLIECQCCYVDAPANRCLPCEDSNMHFFCFKCIRKSAETQIGLMKYKLQCFDVSGCQAKFGRQDLLGVLGASIMDKLDSLEQQDEIRKACLDGLEDCPFCSFKAVCAPVEEDREFRCNNPGCETVSCRLCKEKSHIPLTCEEAKGEKGLSERHEVEEAMSKALIRSCPTCKLNIVKELGCNKMTCPRCARVMCYICKKDITHEMYRHFGHGRNSCTQNDLEFDRHQREVQQAERAAIEKILAEKPNITEEAIRVQNPGANSQVQAQPAVPRINNFVHGFGGQRHYIAVAPPNYAANRLPNLLPQQPPPNQRALGQVAMRYVENYTQNLGIQVPQQPPFPQEANIRGGGGGGIRIEIAAQPNIPGRAAIPLPHAGLDPVFPEGIYTALPPNFPPTNIFRTHPATGDPPVYLGPRQPHPPADDIPTQATPRTNMSFNDLVHHDMPN